MSSAVMTTYARKPVAFAYGEGSYLVADDGRRFLDFAAGIAVCALGHCHPHLVKSLQDQVAKLWHVSNLYEIPEQTRLARRLSAATFMDKVFFCNSGAEALECGVKLTRLYMDHIGQPERYRVITVEGAFHGRTLATIAAGNQANHLAGFEPVVDGFDQVPFGNLNALRAAIGPETAAILIEPVQGEGGMRPFALDYIRELRRICDEFGLLLYVDEVQSGMGRTGKLFAHEWAEITPDIMAMAKGLGGGFPVGACGAVDKVAEAINPGNHGSTFGGNPLAMTAANAVLDVFEEPGFFDHVRAMSGMFWNGLVRIAKAHPQLISEIRGAGLMLGIQCRDITNGELVDRLFDQGMLTVPAADNVVRLLPPLNIAAQEIDDALDHIDRALAAIKGKAA